MAVMMYVWYPLSLRNVEDLLAQRGRPTDLFHPDDTPGQCLKSRDRHHRERQGFLARNIHFHVRDYLRNFSRRSASDRFNA